ncbi:hypothetical protein [Deinococcus multiflagellatus]|nr:hypothetical protein [Deinococcus multiflagellatus]MBZ9715486.1 hypothetical protein [Deinococcus multiflagellatus]
MNWQDRYLTVGPVAFGPAAPDPETGYVKAKPERNLNILALASGLSLAQLPPDIQATRITIAGGTNIAVTNDQADILRNLLPGDLVTISENYTLSTGRVWVDAVVVSPFDTTLHAVQAGPDGVPVEQYWTYSGFEAVILGRPT